MAKGGKREGAGRPKGSKGGHTLEAEKARERIVQRVTAHVDSLINAQLSLAKGTSHVYRIEETEIKGKKVREHVLVTNENEIKNFLDEHEGDSGEVEGVYYYITTKEPNNSALDSLFNRAYGRPKEVVEHTGEVSLKLDV